LHEQEAKPKSLSELAQHETHNADPRAALYLPASHSEHDPAGPLEEPEGHSWHVDALMAPTSVEYLPPPHSMQSDSSSFPVVVEYLPATQGMQVLA
jgi:hypothetical protein